MSHYRLATPNAYWTAIALLALILGSPIAAIAMERSAPRPNEFLGRIGTFPESGPVEVIRESSDFAARLEQLQAFAADADAEWLLFGFGVSLFLIALAFVIQSRPAKGVATLSLEFPASVAGAFQVRLRRAAKRRPDPKDAAAKPNARRTRSPHTRSGVHRETQFDGLAPGFWIAEINGTMSAPRSGVELASVHREIEFEVFSDAVTPVQVVLQTIETQVELRVHWDRQPARDVGVRLRGIPESLRYSGHGVVRISVGLGHHQLVIGAGDRVVERTLEIEDYEPMRSSVDLATSEGLVFKGCPPAVTSFLQGDLGGAARALDRDGQGDIASRLLAELHREQGQVESAACALEKAGELVEAAHLRRTMQDYQGAAELFERAGSGNEAAECYVYAGTWSEAARVYEDIEDWKKAAHAFEQAGEIGGLINALEAQGEYLRAAGLASEIDDRARSIRLLQQVGPKDRDFGQASELLVFAFEHEGHLDLAAQQLERRLQIMPPDETAPQLEFHLAELLEEIGDDERALDVLEVLRDHEPTYPEVATRIEGLRKKLSSSLRQNAAGTFDAAPGATAFVTQARYEVLEEIGSGGMGHVYKARDRRLGREVALKRMPENLRDHPAAVSLFLGEAQAAARMNHPNIVTLYDADQEQGHFFITMELLHGLPLNALLKQHGPFTPPDTARLGLQACAGLAYAHDQGIVHRDIKTANFFITKEKALKIMDFGLAKMVQAVRDKDATLIAGTPLYMAPEQAAGTVTDGRTDLYGLGVTLFELSTGRLPFFEGDVAEQHRHAAPPEPSTIMPGYPPELASLILRLLSKNPDDRHASAAELAAELSAFLDASMADSSARKSLGANERSSASHVTTAG